MTVWNTSQKHIGLGADMYDLEEIRLARTLGRAIEEELKKGNTVPDEVFEHTKNYINTGNTRWRKNYHEKRIRRSTMCKVSTDL